MNIQRHPGWLSVSGIFELTSANADAFHSAVATALGTDLQTVEIDLSHTRTLDAAALGALLSLYQTANRAGSPSVTFRLTNPRPAVQQIIELARLHHLFELSPAAEKPAWPPLPE